MSRVPVVAIVGRSGSGKTTLIERLIPELRRRGKRVGTVKHTHHAFDFDRPGKDSWRLFEAGAEVVAFSSGSQLAVMRRRSAELPFDELVTAYLRDVDLVVVEGYKELSVPMIEVARPGQPLVSREGRLVAVVGDAPPGHPIPWFRPEDIAAIAGFVLRTLFPSAT